MQINVTVEREHDRSFLATVTPVGQFKASSSSKAIRGAIAIAQLELGDLGETVKDADAACEAGICLRSGCGARKERS